MVVSVPAGLLLASFCAFLSPVVAFYLFLPSNNIIPLVLFCFQRTSFTRRITMTYTPSVRHQCCGSELLFPPPPPPVGSTGPVLRGVVFQVCGRLFLPAGTRLGLQHAVHTPKQATACRSTAGGIGKLYPFIIFTDTSLHSTSPQATFRRPLSPPPGFMGEKLLAIRVKYFLLQWCNGVKLASLVHTTVVLSVCVTNDNFRGPLYHGEGRSKI